MPLRRRHARHVAARSTSARIAADADAAIAAIHFRRRCPMPFRQRFLRLMLLPPTFFSLFFTPAMSLFYADICRCRLIIHYFDILSCLLMQRRRARARAARRDELRQRARERGAINAARSANRRLPLLFYCRYCLRPS